MPADGRDDKDIVKQCRKQGASGSMVISNFQFAPAEVRIKLLK